MCSVGARVPGSGLLRAPETLSQSDGDPRRLRQCVCMNVNLECLGLFNGSLLSHHADAHGLFNVPDWASMDRFSRPFRFICCYLCFFSEHLCVHVSPRGHAHLSEAGMKQQPGPAIWPLVPHF